MGKPIPLNRFGIAIQIKLQLSAKMDQRYAKGQKQAYGLMLLDSKAQACLLNFGCLI